MYWFCSLWIDPQAKALGRQSGHIAGNRDIPQYRRRYIRAAVLDRIEVIRAVRWDPQAVGGECSRLCSKCKVPR